MKREDIISNLDKVNKELADKNELEDVCQFNGERLDIDIDRYTYEEKSELSQLITKWDSKLRKEKRDYLKTTKATLELELYRSLSKDIIV
jgi:hypothetical protein